MCGARKQPLVLAFRAGAAHRHPACTHTSPTLRRYGACRWSVIATHLSSGRVGKQCRERWNNHLCPEVKKADWADAEDHAILCGVAEMGTRWCEIIKSPGLTGRTDNAIKNRFYSLQRRTKARFAAGAMAWASADGSPTGGNPMRRSNADALASQQRDRALRLAADLVAATDDASRDRLILSLASTLHAGDGGGDDDDDALSVHSSQWSSPDAACDDLADYDPPDAEEPLCYDADAIDARFARLFHPDSASPLGSPIGSALDQLSPDLARQVERSLGIGDSLRHAPGGLHAGPAASNAPLAAADEWLAGHKYPLDVADPVSTASSPGGPGPSSVETTEAPSPCRRGPLSPGHSAHASSTSTDSGISRQTRALASPSPASKRALDAATRATLAAAQANEATCRERVSKAGIDGRLAYRAAASTTTTTAITTTAIASATTAATTTAATATATTAIATATIPSATTTGSTTAATALAPLLVEAQPVGASQPQRQRSDSATVARGVPGPVGSFPSGMDSDFEAFRYNPAHGSSAGGRVAPWPEGENEACSVERVAPTRTKVSTSVAPLQLPLLAAASELEGRNEACSVERAAPTRTKVPSGIAPLQLPLLTASELAASPLERVSISFFTDLFMETPASPHSSHSAPWCSYAAIPTTISTTAIAASFAPTSVAPATVSAATIAPTLTPALASPSISTPIATPIAATFAAASRIAAMPSPATSILGTRELGKRGRTAAAASCPSPLAPGDCASRCLVGDKRQRADQPVIAT